MSEVTVGTNIVQLMKSSFASDHTKSQWIDIAIEKAKKEATKEEEKRIEHILAEATTKEITSIRNLCRLRSSSEKPQTLRSLLNYKISEDSNIVVHNKNCIGCKDTDSFAMLSIGTNINILDGNNTIESTESGVVDIFINEEQASQLYEGLSKLLNKNN